MSEVLRGKMVRRKVPVKNLHEGESAEVSGSRVRRVIALQQSIPDETARRIVKDVKAQKFKKTIGAVGKDTIKALARAGPELQARLLKGLGLQGYLGLTGGPLGAENLCE